MSRWSQWNLIVTLAKIFTLHSERYRLLVLTIYFDFLFSKLLTLISPYYIFTFESNIDYYFLLINFNYLSDVLLKDIFVYSIDFYVLSIVRMNNVKNTHT